MSEHACPQRMECTKGEGQTSPDASPGEICGGGRGMFRLGFDREMSCL